MKRQKKVDEEPDSQWIKNLGVITAAVVAAANLLAQFVRIIEALRHH